MTIQPNYTSYNTQLQHLQSQQQKRLRQRRNIMEPLYYGGQTIINNSFYDEMYIMKINAELSKIKNEETQLSRDIARLETQLSLEEERMVSTRRATLETQLSQMRKTLENKRSSPEKKRLEAELLDLNPPFSKIEDDLKNITKEMRELLLKPLDQYANALKSRLNSSKSNQSKEDIKSEETEETLGQKAIKAIEDADNADKDLQDEDKYKIKIRSYLPQRDIYEKELEHVEESKLLGTKNVLEEQTQKEGTNISKIPNDLIVKILDCARDFRKRDRANLKFILGR